jgi:E3 ubiquitin-protein ligase NEDD4
MLTLDLKKSNNSDIIQGKLILNVSSNVNAPIRNGTNTLAPGSASRQPSTSSSNSHTQANETASPASAEPSHPPPAHTAAHSDTTRNNDNNNNNNNNSNNNSNSNNNHNLPEGLVFDIPSFLMHHCL